MSLGKVQGGEAMPGVEVVAVVAEAGEMEGVRKRLKGLIRETGRIGGDTF